MRGLSLVVNPAGATVPDWAESSGLRSRFAPDYCDCTCALGCTQQPALTTTKASSAATRIRQPADLTLALESLRKLAEGSDNQASQRTIFYLNQWISSAARRQPRHWKPDRMLDGLPRALRTTPGLERLDKLQFSLDESIICGNFSGSTTFRTCSRTCGCTTSRSARVREQPAARLRPWLKEIETSVGLPEAEQLAIAERLLDWTTRNIQLDPLPPMPKDPLATAGSTETVLPSLARRSWPRLWPFAGGDTAFMAMAMLRSGHASSFAVPAGGHRCGDARISRRAIDGASRVAAGGADRRQAIFVRHGLWACRFLGRRGKGLRRSTRFKRTRSFCGSSMCAGVRPYPVTERISKQGVWALNRCGAGGVVAADAAFAGGNADRDEACAIRSAQRLEPKLRRANVAGVALWSVPLDAVWYRIGISSRLRQIPQWPMSCGGWHFCFRRCGR